MPQNKLAFARYKLIDRELRRKEYVKTFEIVDICKEEFGFIVSSRAIQLDINSMRYDSVLEYYAPIAYCNRRKAFYYTDPSYSIVRFGLQEEEVNTLQLFAGKLNLYKEYPIFKDFSSAIEKVLNAVQIRKSMKSIEQRQFIQTQNSPKCVGTEYIPRIITALEENRVLEFEYRKYGSNEIKTRIFQPYLLKEDSNRWYVVGKLNKQQLLRTFALDRFLSLEVSNVSFTVDDVDFEEYFRYSFGIIVQKGAPVEVTLSYKPKQGNYVKSLPIHHTQKIIKDDQEELRISIIVKPSYEFYSKILSYGCDVEVISPPEIRSEIKRRIKILEKMYK